MLHKRVVRAVFVVLALVSGVGVSLARSVDVGPTVILAGDDEPTRPTGC